METVSIYLGTTTIHKSGSFELVTFHPKDGPSGVGAAVRQLHLPTVVRYTNCLSWSVSSFLLNMKQTIHAFNVWRKILAYSDPWMTRMHF